MTTFALFGLVWLAASIVLAPMVGRMIHDPTRCPQCRAKADTKARREYLAGSPVRCWCCPGAPLVDDYQTHTRLAHHPSGRPVGPEDNPRWTP